MPPLPYINPDDSLWSWMAYDLRFYREKHGQSQEAVGRLLGVTKQQVHNFESGLRKIHKGQAETLDRVWETGGHFARLRKFAIAGHTPDWFRTYIHHEAKAHTIKSFELVVVPGLLQTPAYARALLTAGEVVDDVEAAVAARMARKEVLARNPDMWVLIAEFALEIPIGGREVMREQLAHLLEVSHQPRMRLRVVPKRTGGHVGLDGGFSVITTKTEEVAYITAFAGGRLAQEGSEVRKCALRFDRIGADALSRVDSRMLIKEAMEAML